ncbi:MAG: hypothetical protein B5M56_05295 [Desulfococcus sp. 4484_241]|nr:MAG: hypothetical protein B5M56_05295 [Desulfococcus sp. 4484_241]RLC32714.1 MAG: hypothetical protein DRH32_02485 [Deltaproteobacteria bacterium]
MSVIAVIQAIRFILFITGLSGCIINIEVVFLSQCFLPVVRICLKKVSFIAVFAAPKKEAACFGNIKYVLSYPPGH